MAQSGGGQGVEFASAFGRAAEVHGRAASAIFDANVTTADKDRIEIPHCNESLTRSPRIQYAVTNSLAKGQRMPSNQLKRREFITLLGGAAAWPFAARAQPNRTWRIGYLSATETPGEPQAQSRRLIMEAALAQLGYVEGNNLAIDRRLLSERVELVNEAAAELVGLRPDAIVAVNTPDVAAALSVTKTIPIVFVNPADPIGSGFIASLARPGRNATGTTG